MFAEEGLPSAPAPTECPQCKNAVAVGLGIRSDKGVLGAGYDRKISDTNLVYLSVGLDPGELIGAGFRQRISAWQSGEKWFQKCFSLFACEKQVLIGVGIKYINGTSFYRRLREVGEGLYWNGPKWMAGAAIVLRNNYKNRVFSDVEISYRHKLTEPDINLLSGQEAAEDKDAVRSWDNGIGIGISIGYWM